LVERNDKFIFILKEAHFRGVGIFSGYYLAFETEQNKKPGKYGNQYCPAFHHQMN
jgi:hypothetical protein